LPNLKARLLQIENIGKLNSVTRFMPKERWV
jgi:hypothetical protein